MTAIVCDACKLPPPDGWTQTPPDGGLAPGWAIRRISGRTFTLCDCCGSIRHFKGGISAYLQSSLGLSDDATLEYDDTPGSGLHRHRVKRRAWQE